jgi:hypothetical protein
MLKCWALIVCVLALAKKNHNEVKSKIKSKKTTKRFEPIILPGRSFFQSKCIIIRVKPERIRTCIDSQESYWQSE